MPTTSHTYDKSRDLPMWRVILRERSVWLTGILIVLTIILQSAQLFHDYRDTQVRTAFHIDGHASQLQRALESQIGMTRQLFGAIDLVMDGSGERRDSLSLPSREQLFHLRELYRPALPGLEFLVLDEHRHIVRETDSAILNDIPNILPIIDRLATADAPPVTPDTASDLRGKRNFIISKVHLDQQGHRRAYVIAVMSTDALTHPLELVALKSGDAPLIALTDASERLVARYPSLPSVVNGMKLRVDESPREGPHPGSYYGKSPADGVTRLLVKRDISMPLAGQHWTLRVGYAVKDYQQSWNAGVAYDIVTAILLVITWIVVLMAKRHEVQMLRQTDASRNTMQRLLTNLPVPIMLVAQDDQLIIRGNGAMEKIFGAMANSGCKAASLFADVEGFTRLTSAGAQETVVVLTRNGEATMLANSTEIIGLASQTGPCWLVTLVDVTEQQSEQKKLQAEATTDPLTGLSNRRSFERASELAIDRDREQQAPLAVLSLDLDRFKSVNDQYGHDAGDLVLMRVARLMEAALRDGDLAARLGGEEFAILLPNISLQHAMAVAERIRRSIAVTPVPLPDGRMLTITISIGVAMYRDDEFDLSPALKRADQALYRAKENGRNRVEPEPEAILNGHPSVAI